MKKILAIVLALALTLGTVICLASCGNTETEETTAAETEAVETEAAEAESTEAASEDASAADAEAATDAEASTEAEAAEGETETTAAIKAPELEEDILEVYNEAVNGAISAKAGYSKTRVTNINNLNGGALLKIQLVVDTVNNFLGQGTTTYTNSKGKADYMSKASLTASDINSAKCTEKDGKYTITLDVKNGSSSAPGSDNSAIKRTGVYVGTGDKSEFDYKGADNIYYALNNTDGASVESVKLSTNSVKVTAVVDAATGHLENLKVSFNFDVSMTNVKYSIAKVSAADGDATTTVTFKDFKY